MKVSLFNFQKKAVEELRKNAYLAHMSYETGHVPQIISFTAPTGSGKTIILAEFVERVLYGDEFISEQPDAIFVWLSDSPQLNEQSKMKFDLLADRIKLSQCTVIDDDSFDQEMFEEGQIYFLNTQKLSKSGNLTKHSDSRQYTIWETFQNTIDTKSDKLYLIIDEAHRGTQGREAGKATSIMQKFIKGSMIDAMSPLPVVIGMSATSERFNKLAKGTTSTTHYVVVPIESVRASGLLKDRIIVQYPGNSSSDNEMAILQAAVDEWKQKCEHWYQYTYEQHYANVNPILVIQVSKGSYNNISDTNLEDVIEKIEERLGTRLKLGEIVHSFGDQGDISINGLKIVHVNASDINDNKAIKIVLFKESLSTGWDCPRAETMMSFRKAIDSTYIAQLLGRMIRTPLQMRVKVDESLNDVHLYLPHFDSHTVEDVLQKLKDAEGGEIPTYIETETIEDSKYKIASVKHSKPSYFADDFENNHNEHKEMDLFDFQHKDDENRLNRYINRETPSPYYVKDAHNPVINNITGLESEKMKSDEISDLVDIDREAVVKYVNDSKFSTYEVKRVRINDYLDSLFKIARFITQTALDMDCLRNIKLEIIEKIHDYAEQLHAANRYDSLANKVLEFKLLSKMYDSFGERIDEKETVLVFQSDSDLDRQLRNADVRLKNEGIASFYGQKYYSEEHQNAFKIDVILYVANDENMRNLTQYAKDKFHELDDEFRRKTAKLRDRYKKQYHDIVADADEVSKHLYSLPETISMRIEKDGEKYYDHLYVPEEGYATLKLNTWEREVIKQEEKQDDYICFLRNPSRGNYSLCIKYEIDGEEKAMYPDFLVFRKDDDSYVMDILEPHGAQFSDSLAKAKGLAHYAIDNPGIGRIQMIRVDKDIDGVNKFKRLNLSKGLVREKILKAMTNDEFNHIFDTEGIFD